MDNEILAYSKDGQYRAVLVHEDYPHEPEDDGRPPMLRVELNRWNSSAYAVSNRDSVYAVILDTFLERASSNREGVELFERYLRIFHGTRKVHTYGPNNRTDYTYLCFDTDEWAERVGLELDSEHRAENGMEEYIAYLEGDVYGLLLERKEDGACGHDGCEEHTQWIDEEAVWGYYGDTEYTRNAYKELFAPFSG